MQSLLWLKARVFSPQIFPELLVTDRAKRRKGCITNSPADNASESMGMKR